MASDPNAAARPLATFLLTLASLGSQSPPTAAPSPQTPAQPIAAVPRTRATTAAAQIDRLLAAGLAKRGEQATPLIDDATFVRRTYLQIVGRIPSGAETEAFLADQAADRRQLLIDRLLDSPGYTSNEANFWFDLLRVKSRQRQLSGEPFAHWIREQIRLGTPYDKFVSAMLTATGPANAEGNGATGYLLRDMNMPHDAMANTLRLFLGTRVECAQCHNHPFDKWTQRDFYAASAYFGGLRYRVDVDRDLVQELRQTVAQGDDRQKQAARRVLQTFAIGLAGNGTGVERLPDDYKYDDAKPRDPVFADTPFGADTKLERARAPAPPSRLRARQERPMRPAGAPEIDSRAAFADWLTSSRNPRFARVIVNRVWQRIFGRGLCEPLDDLKDATAAVYPELENHLVKLLVDLRFDLRQFERVLLLTRLFQQQALAHDPSTEDAYAFQAPLLRRMTAEQLWDSLLTLAVDDIDARLQPTDARAQEIYRRHDELAHSTPEQLAAILERPLRPNVAQQAVQQGQQRLQAIMAEVRSRPPAEQQEILKLQRELAGARRRSDAAAIDQIWDRLAALGIQRPGERGGLRDADFLRASDMQQPAQPEHLLRQFGQSDRETMDAASLAATVPQALALMNGPVASSTSSLRRRIAAGVDPQQKVRAAFFAVLSREPHEGELATWCAEFDRNAARATQDLVWVLVNSSEFRFRP